MSFKSKVEPQIFDKYLDSRFPVNVTTREIRTLNRELRPWLKVSDDVEGLLNEEIFVSYQAMGLTLPQLISTCCS